MTLSAHERRVLGEFEAEFRNLEKARRYRLRSNVRVILVLVGCALFCAAAVALASTLSGATRDALCGLAGALSATAAAALLAFGHPRQVPVISPRMRPKLPDCWHRTDLP